MAKINTSKEFLNEGKQFFKKYNKDYIFIRVPKNASTSIINSVGKIRHYSTQFISEDVGLDLSNYFTFCIVRNPFDRLVSWFHYHKHNVNAPNDKSLQKNYKNSTFKEWVDNGCPLPNSWTQEKDKYNPNPLHQYLWLTDTEGNLNVDFVGKYETLNDDIKYISEKLDIQIKLSKLNKSKHSNYTEYYDKETVEKVSEMFKKDLELFDYSFDEI